MVFDVVVRLFCLVGCWVGVGLKFDFRGLRERVGILGRELC